MNPGSEKPTPQAGRGALGPTFAAGLGGTCGGASTGEGQAGLGEVGAGDGAAVGLEGVEAERAAGEEGGPAGGGGRGISPRAALLGQVGLLSCPHDNSERNTTVSFLPPLSWVAPPPRGLGLHPAPSQASGCRQRGFRVWERLWGPRRGSHEALETACGLLCSVHTGPCLRSLRKALVTPEITPKAE